MAAMGDQRGQLQPTQSSHSTSSSSTFRSAFPAGSLDPPGVPPPAKVYIRPTSGKRSKKPSALDKHLRHVVLLQRSNRHAAHQHAATAQHKHKQHQRFLDWGHRLRKAILHRGSSPTSSNGDYGSSSPEPAQLITAPAQKTAGNDCSSPQQHDDNRADIIQSWKPVAAAAQTRELQESLTKQERRTRRKLPRVLDPNTLRPDYQIQQQQLLQMQDDEGYNTGMYSTISRNAHAAQSAAGHMSPGKGHTQALGAGTAAAAGQHAGQSNDQEGALDVDAFLDGLLQTASSQHTSVQPAAAAGKPTGSHPSTKQHAHPASTQPQHDSQRSQHSSSPLGSKQRSGSPQQRPGSRGRAMPAWAVSEQAAAAAEAAAAEEEEESLLQFAEGLEWQELLQDLGDEDLAEAFKELELADSAATEGQPDADKRWQQCFVTALNAAAMKGIADTTSASAGEGSQQGDKHSFTSSASAVRRAEAAAARGQQLLHRLHRLTGTQAASATAAAGASPLGAGAGPGSVKAGSVCGSTGNRRGVGNSGLAAAAGATDADSWDSSTIVSSSGEDVGRVRSAIKHIEAGEVLSENPDMRGVHSTASVRSMLSRMDAAA